VASQFFRFARTQNRAAYDENWHESKKFRDQGVIPRAKGYSFPDMLGIIPLHALAFCGTFSKRQINVYFANLLSNTKFLYQYAVQNPLTREYNHIGNIFVGTACKRVTSKFSESEICQ